MPKSAWVGTSSSLALPSSTTPLAPGSAVATASWGSITGSSAQASPGGGWSTAASFGSNAVSMGALTATVGAFGSGYISLTNSIALTTGGLNNLGIQTASGLTKIGMLNSSYCHYDTAASSGNYFYQSITGAANLSITGESHLTGVVNLSNGIFMNRGGASTPGINWYSRGYTAWQEYMGPAGVSGQGWAWNITPPSGTYVTTWALRSFIENINGYGWTWESAANGSTTPSIVAELSSYSGNFRTIGGAIFGGGATLTTGYPLWQTFNYLGSALWCTAHVMGQDTGYSQGAARIRTAYTGANLTTGYSNFVIDLATNTCAYGTDPSGLSFTQAFAIDGYSRAAYVNGSMVLTIGNVGLNAATLQAAVANATAPMIGTDAQMRAYAVPGGYQPYWYATDDVNTNDGTMGALYQYITGTGWTYVNQPQAYFPKVTAGVISAGAIGAAALNATIVMTSVINSTGYYTGTSSAAPYGFKLSGSAFSVNCWNGDSTGTYASSGKTVFAEFGAGVSIGGFYLGDLALGRLVNAGYKTYSPGTYSWVCPPGIYQVEVTLVGGGGSGCKDSSNPAGGGGGGMLRYISSVTPGTTYTVVCGSGGAGVSGGTGNAGGNSTFNGLTAYGGSAGVSGAGGYGGGAGTMGSMSSGNGTLAMSAVGAFYLVCAQGAMGGSGGTTYPGSTQWQSGNSQVVYGGGTSPAGPSYGNGSDGRTASGSTLAGAGSTGLVILRW